jgi:hypothetical protein
VGKGKSMVCSGNLVHGFQNNVQLQDAWNLFNC